MKTIVAVPEPRCDECKKPVEQQRIETSARNNNGIAIGPFLCQSCSDINDAVFEQALKARQHQQAVQHNAFDTLCSECDPELAEAIHRAGL